MLVYATAAQQSTFIAFYRPPRQISVVATEFPPMATRTKFDSAADDITHALTSGAEGMR